MMAKKINDVKLILIHFFRRLAPPVQSDIILSGKWKPFADQPLQHLVLTKLAY